MLTYISNSGHYTEVHTIWIGTTNIKDLYNDIGR